MNIFCSHLERCGGLGVGVPLFGIHGLQSLLYSYILCVYVFCCKWLLEVSAACLHVSQSVRAPSYSCLPYWRGDLDKHKWYFHNMHTSTLPHNHSRRLGKTLLFLSTRGRGYFVRQVLTDLQSFTLRDSCIHSVWLCNFKISLFFIRKGLKRTTDNKDSARLPVNKKHN